MAAEAAWIRALEPRGDDDLVVRLERLLVARACAPDYVEALARELASACAIALVLSSPDADDDVVLRGLRGYALREARRRMWRRRWASCLVPCARS